MSSDRTASSANLITDIAGIRVGHADDARIGSGATAVLFDTPATASIAIHGGAPGSRDSALLAPEMTVDKIDALVLSGGSVFGLDAPGGVIAFLREQGRGFDVGGIKVPIVPGAVMFDLLNGGEKAWGARPVYWNLGYHAAASTKVDFALGSVGAGLGATLVDLKGGLGSASAVSSTGFSVGALVVVNSIGQATIGDGPHFWAAPYERAGEFGGCGWPQSWPSDAALRLKGDTPQNTTIGIVATDAALTKAQAKHMAVMAQDGLARALRPAHGALDGDTIFAVSMATTINAPSPRDLTEIGSLAADCLARAIARGVFEAEPLPFPGALPSWKDKFS